MRVLSLLLAALLLLVGLAAIPPPAKASPVFFEEDFAGCAVGADPAGWTHTSTGDGTIECDDAEFFPDVNGYPGSQSFRQSLTSSFIDAWLSPAFSIGGATQVSVGFAVRFEAFSSSTSGGAWQVNARDSLAIFATVGVNDTGEVSTLNSTFVFNPIGFTMVLDTFYVVRMDLDRTTGNYSTFINGTQVQASETMVPTAGGQDLDQIQYVNRNLGKSWIDWLFVGDVTLDPIPDEQVLEGSPVSVDAGTDASTDVIFALPTGPAFLSIDQQTGLVTGTPTATGTFPVTVTANVSTGQDSESFILTVTGVDALAWIREFGPAWVIFLAFVAVIIFILLMLWRGARGRPRRR